MSETVSTRGRGEGGGREEEEDNPNTKVGRGGGWGICTWDVSSSNLRSVSPCLYVDAVIFESSYGCMPAFLKPACTLCSEVACSHAMRVRRAMVPFPMIPGFEMRCAANADAMYLLNGPNTEISETCSRCVV